MGDFPLRTPTHRRFGGPLPRQLPNGTHAHPQSINFYLPYHAVRQDHQVLIFLSEGYPRFAERLHTRYSPIRRSPTPYCYGSLPLDLHVLGLSLAFILSQDQTLHCEKCLFFILFRELGCQALRPDCYLAYATLVYRNFLKDLSSRESLETAVPKGHRALFPIADAKLGVLSELANYSQKKIQ